MSPHRAPGPGSARLQDSDRKKLRPSAPTSQASSLPTSLLEEIRAAAARARLWRNLEELVRMGPTAASSPGRHNEDDKEASKLGSESPCLPLNPASQPLCCALSDLPGEEGRCPAAVDVQGYFF